MKRFASVVAAALAIGLLSTLPFSDALAGSRTAQQSPGMSTFTWVVRWPSTRAQSVVSHTFKARPGVLKSVRLFFGDTPVSGPPHYSFVACEGETYPAAAQKAWLWDGRHVYVSLLLSPGTGRTSDVRVVLRTAGT